jgi:hypothetical protein
MNRTTLAVRLILAFVLTRAILPARAMLPESGWYWHSAESGRGFNIEIQDNQLFMAAFVYRPDGSPAWYIGGGPMGSDRTWSAQLYETAGGQCVGCPYRLPTLVPSGSVSISFTSERTATISILGGTLNVFRQDWSNSGVHSRDALFGEWSFTEGDPVFPVYFGDRISLYMPLTDASGPYAGGNRTGSLSNAAVGSYRATSNLQAILVDSSTSYYSLFLFPMNTLNRVEGLAWTFLKTSSPSGGGMYFLAHRTKSYTRVRGFNAPGVTKAAIDDTEREAIDAMRAARAQAKAGVPIALEGVTLEGIQEIVRELEAQLPRER